MAETTEPVHFVLFISLGRKSPKIAYVTGKMIRSSIVYKLCLSVTLVTLHPPAV